MIYTVLNIKRSNKKDLQIAGLFCAHWHKRKGPRVGLFLFLFEQKPGLPRVEGQQLALDAGML